MTDKELAPQLARMGAVELLPPKPQPLTIEQKAAAFDAICDHRMMVEVSSVDSDVMLDDGAAFTEPRSFAGAKADTYRVVMRAAESCQPSAEDGTGYCPACHGSGEGMYDGSRCGTCRGRGEV